jgi:hypothetical protein
LYSGRQPSITCRYGASTGTLLVQAFIPEFTFEAFDVRILMVRQAFCDFVHGGLFGHGFCDQVGEARSFLAFGIPGGAANDLHDFGQAAARTRVYSTLFLFRSSGSQTAS